MEHSGVPGADYPGADADGAGWAPVETPKPTETWTPVPTPTPEHTGPTTIVINGLELDGIDDLWVGIPVDGMPE